MPFPKDAGGIACFAEKIGDGFFFPVENGNSADGVVNAEAQSVSPGEEKSPAGRAIRRGMEVGEVYALFRKGIDVRCFDQGMTMATQFVIALVIGQNEENVWGSGKRSREKEGEEKEESFYCKEWTGKGHNHRA